MSSSYEEMDEHYDDIDEGFYEVDDEFNFEDNDDEIFSSHQAQKMAQAEKKRIMEDARKLYEQNNPGLPKRNLTKKEPLPSRSVTQAVESPQESIEDAESTQSSTQNKALSDRPTGLPRRDVRKETRTPRAVPQKPAVIDSQSSSDSGNDSVETTTGMTTGNDRSTRLTTPSLPDSSMSLSSVDQKTKSSERQPSLSKSIAAQPSSDSITEDVKDPFSDFDFDFSDDEDVDSIFNLSFEDEEDRHSSPVDAMLEEMDDEDDEPLTTVMSPSVGTLNAPPSSASTPMVNKEEDNESVLEMKKAIDRLKKVTAQAPDDTVQSQAHDHEQDDRRKSHAERVKEEAQRRALLDDQIEGKIIMSKDKKSLNIRKTQTNFKRSDAYEMTVDESGHKKSVQYRNDGTEIHFGSRKRARRKRSSMKEPNAGIAPPEKDFYLKINSSVRKIRNDPNAVGQLQKALSRDDIGVRARFRLEEAMHREEAYAKGFKTAFDNKDFEIIRFLAMFKYATTRNLSQLIGVTERATNMRTAKLEKQGMIQSKRYYYVGNMWYLTEAGLLFSDINVPRTVESMLKPPMFSHTIAINHVAANLWSGGVNVLGLPDHPMTNRVDASGNVVAGETLISELQIQSSLTKMRGVQKANDFRPRIIGIIEDEFSKWENHPQRSKIPSPETREGNEYMWALVPRSRQAGIAYHVPDLVVARNRTPDGKPQSIAVEVEISNKSKSSYENTLMAYLEDDKIYSKVVWVCKTRGTAAKLEEIAKRIGLWRKDQERIFITPIITKDNTFFSGNDIWRL